ncbi:hypothetical protein CJ195_15925 [Bacillus sp. UMB0899]|nr:hypothetical protein CJ195_15925 [Bacillus sp. UMB0899]
MTFEAKKKAEKRELILNHQVDGEAYILSSSYKWKNIVLINFNKIKRKEMTLEECLKFIAKIFKVDLDVDF